MNVEIDLKCRSDGNNRISFSANNKKDLITVETFKGAYSQMIQITFEDWEMITNILKTI